MIVIWLLTAWRFSYTICAMNRFNIFIMRAVLAAFFAVVITRFFYGRVAPLYVAGLAVFLAGMSYVTEYYRHKR